MGTYSDRMKTGVLMDIEMRMGQENLFIVKQKVAEGGGG